MMRILRLPRKDNMVSYNISRLQFPQYNLRHHYVRTTVQVRQYSDESLGLFFGNRCLGYYDTEGKIIGPTLELQKVA